MVTMKEWWMRLHLSSWHIALCRFLFILSIVLNKISTFLFNTMDRMNIFLYLCLGLINSSEEKWEQLSVTRKRNGIFCFPVLTLHVIPNMMRMNWASFFAIHYYKISEYACKSTRIISEKGKIFSKCIRNMQIIEHFAILFLSLIIIKYERKRLFWSFLSYH